MNKQAEFEFLVQFIKQKAFDVEIWRDQLRALWTAYCLHHDVEVDTYSCDMAILDLWEAVDEMEGDTSDWSDIDTFNEFMCGFMV